MLDDVLDCRELGVAGGGVGCLTADGRIDEARMTALIEAAQPLRVVTCHRAFDMTRESMEAIEALVRCGVDRVLTSGQGNSALEGADLLKAVHDAARGRIVVMICGQVDETNIAEVLRRREADELHFASLVTVSSGMDYRNPHANMGSTAMTREFELTLTDPEAVRRTIAAARA